MKQPVPKFGPIELPKAPHWDPKRSCFFFVDALQSCIHKYVPKSGIHKIAKVGTEPMAFVIPIKDTDDEFIVSYGDKVAKLQWDGNSDMVHNLTLLGPIGENVYRANEGKVSPSGSLFIGGHSPVVYGKVQKHQAALYAYYRNNISKKLLDKVSIANGMGWSSDNKKFYFIDSLARTVESFSYDKENDTLSDRIVLINFEKEHNIPGVPYGMAIDAADKLWITFGRGYTVVQVCPVDRKILLKMELDAFKITSAVFAGDELKDFYITTGNFEMTEEQMSEYPHSGYIFEAKDFMVRGRPVIQFDLYGAEK